jgi:membrane protein
MKAIRRGFEENDLFTYASAISFRVLFAVVPLALVGLGLLGAFELAEVWSDEIAPRVQDEASPAAFQVIDDTVRKVLDQKQIFWVTVGALIAIWEVSGAMRAVMAVLSRVYQRADERSVAERGFLSIWLAALVTALLLGAVAAVVVLPRWIDGFGGTILGWALGILLLFAGVGSIVRFAPANDRPLRWVSRGSVVVIAGWVAGSLLFRWYATSLADYGSIFGSLAVVMIAFGYVYLMTIVFLTGLQLDALIGHEEPEEEDEPKPEIIVAKSLASAQH